MKSLGWLEQRSRGCHLHRRRDQAEPARAALLRGQALASRLRPDFGLARDLLR